MRTRRRGARERRSRREQYAVHRRRGSRHTRCAAGSEEMSRVRVDAATRRSHRTRHPCGDSQVRTIKYEAFARSYNGDAMTESSVVDAFIRAATVPMTGGYESGTLDEAEALRSTYPDVARTNVHAAAVAGDTASVRRVVGREGG